MEASSSVEAGHNQSAVLPDLPVIRAGRRMAPALDL